MKFPKLIFRKTVPIVGTDKQGIGRVPINVGRELVKTNHAEILRNHPAVIGLKHINNKTASSNRVFSASPLKNLIHTASLFASKGSRSAILNSLLFKIVDNKLYVTATDLESHFIGYIAPGSNYSFTHESGINGVCIDARYFGKILSSQNNNLNLHIMKGKDNPILRVGEFLIEGGDASGFPDAPFQKRVDKVYQCAVENIEKKLVFISKAISNSKYRAALSGIYFDIARQQFVGSDGNRLHVMAMNESEKNPNGKHAIEGVIVPASVLKIVRLLTGAWWVTEDRNTDQEVYQYINFALNVPGCNNSTATFRTIDGQFPRYEDVIPQEFTSRFTTRTRDLLPVLNKALIADTTDSDSKPILVEFKNGQMIVTVNVRGRITYRGVVQGQYTGTPYRSTINVIFLLDTVQTMPEDSVEILLQSKGDNAWMIRNGLGHTAVLMPIEIKGSE